MGLSSVLSSANMGLNITQSALDVVARNIANADTPGYSRKALEPAQVLAGGELIGLNDVELRRTVDSFLQSQIRVETASFQNAELKFDFLSRIDKLFGAPGAENALDTLVNDFSSALQQLTGSPDNFAVREQVVVDAETLAQQLRQLSGEVQSLRQLAEDTLADDINELNNALGSLHEINQQLALGAVNDVPSANLLDERDKFLSQISEFIEIRVTERPNGTVSVISRAGNTLLGTEPVTLEFDRHGDITANSFYSSNPADREVGTIELVSGGGHRIDLIENDVLRTGRIGALVELRDQGARRGASAIG